MARSTMRSRWIILSAVVVFQAACHNQKPESAPRPQTSAIDSTAIFRARAEAAAKAEAARRDSIARAARADSIKLADATRRAAEARRALVAPVHFDLDQDVILDAERSMLDRKVAILAATPAVEVSITGNTDERGSDEYNLALGMRRAGAVIRYLVDDGIDSRRLSTASNGEERPICQQHDESCWMQNRRAEIAVTRGAESIARR
jgi:peptidoglycan-associated lipoprotein